MKDKNFEELSDNQKAYQRKINKQELPDFIKMINYDYNTELIERYIGDEKRTFHILNKSVPLLSPSRCLKWLNEHIWWSIPNKNLVRPRLFGQIVHLNIEYHFNAGQYELFTNKNIIPWLGKDVIYWDAWSKEIQDKFIKDLNIAIPKIIKTLEENKIKVLSVEKHVSNETFHGFIDILGTKGYKGTGYKTPVLIDLKTTTDANIKPEHILQLSIYKKILKDIPQTYILFYDTNNYECKLIQIYQKEINNTFKKIEDLINLFRKK